MISIRFGWHFPTWLCGRLFQHDIGRMRRNDDGSMRWWECFCRVKGGTVQQI